MDPRYLLRQSADLIREAVIGGKHRAAGEVGAAIGMCTRLPSEPPMLMTHAEISEDELIGWPINHSPPCEQTVRELYCKARAHASCYVHRIGCLRTGGVAAGHVKCKGLRNAEDGKVDEWKERVGVIHFRVGVICLIGGVDERDGSCGE